MNTHNVLHMMNKNEEYSDKIQGRAEKMRESHVAEFAAIKNKSNRQLTKIQKPRRPNLIAVGNKRRRKYRK